MRQSEFICDGTEPPSIVDPDYDDHRKCGLLTVCWPTTDRQTYLTSHSVSQLVSLAYCHQRLHFKCVHIIVPAEDQNCNTIARTATEGMWSQWKKIMVFVTQCRLLHCTYVPDPPQVSPPRQVTAKTKTMTTITFIFVLVDWRMEDDGVVSFYIYIYLFKWLPTSSLERWCVLIVQTTNSQ